MTFPRLPDHERAWALVERDDGVVYRLYSGTAGPRLPHDIMHLVVERELRISDGIWAGIAAGGPGQPPGQPGRPPGQRAVDLGDERLEHAVRRDAERLAGLGAVGLVPRVVGVLVQRERDLGPFQRRRRRRPASRHDWSP